MFAIEQIVPLVARNTVVVNFRGEIGKSFEVAISLVIMEFEFKSLYCSWHSSM